MTTYVWTLILPSDIYLFNLCIYIFTCWPLCYITGHDDHTRYAFSSGIGCVLLIQNDFRHVFPTQKHEEDLNFILHCKGNVFI